MRGSRETLRREGVTLVESSGFQIDDGVDKRRLEMGSLKGIAK
jgi:hypothetical protein